MKKKYDQIVVIDSFSFDSFHEMFNAEMLCIYSHLFLKVKYYGQNRNIENILKIRPILDNVSFDLLKSFSGRGRWTLLGRYIWAALVTVKVILLNRKEKYIALNNNNPFLLPLLYVIMPFVKSNIFVCCHGELELLLPNKSIGILAGIQGKILELFFLKKKVDEKLSFIVLGDSIMLNLKQLLPNYNYNRFGAINHPYKFDDDEVKFTPLSTTEIRIGIIGQTNVAKGYSSLLQLAQTLKNRENNIKVIHIGKLVGDVALIRSLGIEVVDRDSNGELPREEYKRWIASLHYTLFLYPVDSYKLIASGALFESIASGKPIIALCNDYFKYVFNLTGNIGYLHSSIGELCSFLENMQVDAKEYCLLKRKLIAAQSLFSIESVKEEVRFIIG
ncbi:MULTISPECIES: glycosyltransferase [Bacteroides]|mgnify:FL=1|jgi:glycosyltransferase involved in cell wall biosynthesis|uniref:glycosyltransferase n=1 Tax=Bacteroides TaxID=816 RepID=UPI00164C0540|nr:MULTISPECIES: glycosyltransferase [Bacteroides]MBC5615095.1 glycosyltransferase [Bacteroides hominis (ex Liu et al. 2022)]MCM0193608.1 glycosyltransferase [Bacteroides fragilis]MCM0199053.1 glycosyltransferase [Bacteroides fragilis]MCM0209779.1 glycosyltransferase [Bacteroides fragilis]MCM0214196.1 glycosyltransferase [Bacteroides fragilis]